MQWNDKAIIISVRRLGEHSGVIHLLTAERGLHAGVDRGAFGKRRQGIYQPGNVVEATWQARLSEHVGNLTCELSEPIASKLLDSRLKLAAILAATQMIERVLAERDPQQSVYARLAALLHAMCHSEQEEWLKAYVQLEYTLLESSGFGLDLERCAATGQSHDLYYISPRTGRAVSREAGLPYHDKMFRLPPYLLGKESILLSNQTHILDGMQLCGHFLEERVFISRNVKLPGARARFMAMLPELELV